MIGKSIIIINRPEPKSNEQVTISKGKITKLLFTLELPQASINRKTRAGRNKYGKLTFYTSDTLELWSANCKWLVAKAMRDNNLIIDQGYYAVRTLLHLQYNKPQGKRIIKQKIDKNIKDDDSCMKNTRDMMEDILYSNDRRVMYSESSYSGKVIDYSEKQDPMMTLEVYLVEEVKDDHKTR